MQNPYVNLGAGQPARGWINLDSSPLFKVPRGFHRVAARTGICRRSMDFVDADYAWFRWREGEILPFSNDSVRAIYCSHVFEHLPASTLSGLLKECRRVLIPEGIARVVVPDLEQALAQGLAADAPFLDLEDRLGLVPASLRQRGYRAAIEGWFSFPSLHRTIVRPDRLCGLLDAGWRVRTSLAYLQSDIDAGRLQLVERESRCQNALIFEMTKTCQD
ncbi:MAG: methyltransferase domain-containing protein [Candidatus Hydrogenedentes bacterium]|nr:methyltransferase domain-containing protein [Candidatus Hydrogenedentota bacterium]